LVKLVEPLTVRRISGDVQELGRMKAHLGRTFQITKASLTPYPSNTTLTYFELLAENTKCVDLIYARYDLINLLLG
jgi:hypothetical protein